MITLKRVLVATDFSQHSHSAVDYASALAERFDSELHLLHVAPDSDSGLIVPGIGYPSPEVFRHEVFEKAEKALTQVAVAAGDKPVVREVRHGVPFVEIVRYAKEKEIDLIVVGTHGRSGLRHVLLGSVAERVVRKAPCPVLTVRPEGHQFVMP